MNNMRLIKFEIVTPEKVVLKEEITQITVPTRDGEITVLPGHIPLIASLKPGVIEVKKENGEVEIMATSGGFIEVLKDKIVILADTAERAADINIEKANEARLRAEEAKERAQHEEHIELAEVSANIAKEAARTKAYDRWKKIKSLKD